MLVTGFGNACVQVLPDHPTYENSPAYSRLNYFQFGATQSYSFRYRSISCVAKTFLEEEMPEGLRELYIEELKDLYNAENQLVKALPKMAKAASSDELRQGFEEHLEQTKGHVQRLEKIFQALGKVLREKNARVWKVW